MASELLHLIIITLLTVWVCIILLILFVLGDADGDLWIDTVYRCIYVRPGRLFKNIVWSIFGDRGVKWLTGIYEYIMYTNNCLVQVLYILVIVGGYSIFLYGGAPYLPNAFLAEYHKYTSFLVVGICLVTFVIASVTDAGVITKENVELYNAVYPTDGVVFLPNHQCTTCELQKPGRSKHCKICDVCVARFDHHCVWIANDVGALNYRWFMLFLVVHTLICIYGAVGMSLCLYHEYRRHNLWAARFVHPRTGLPVTTNWGIIVQYMLNRYMSMVLLAFLCTPLALAMIMFTTYHVYMGFWLNRTTNESCKTPADIPDLYSRGRIVQRTGETDMDAALRTGMESLTNTYNTPRSVLRNVLEILRPHRWLRLRGYSGLQQEDCAVPVNRSGENSVALHGQVCTSTGAALSGHTGKPAKLRKRKA